MLQGSEVLRPYTVPDSLSKMPNSFPSLQQQIPFHLELGTRNFVNLQNNQWPVKQRFPNQPSNLIVSKLIVPALIIPE